MKERLDLGTNGLAFASLTFMVPASGQGGFLVTYKDSSGNEKSSYVPQTEPPLATIDSAQIGRIAVNAIRTNQPRLEPDDLVPQYIVYEHAAGLEDYINAGYNCKSGKPITTVSTNLTATTTETINVLISNSGAVQGVSSGSIVEYKSNQFPEPPAVSATGPATRSTPQVGGGSGPGR